MALVNVESALRRVLEIMKKRPVGAGVEVLTYKRNRGLSIIKESFGIYRVRERGYVCEEIVVREAELPRLIRSILKRECPRSRKVRIYTVDGKADLEHPRKRL